MRGSRPVASVVTVAAVALIILAGCSSPAAGAPSGSVASPTATTSATSATAPTSTPAPSKAGSTLAVDLAFTGTVSLTLSGAVGSCNIGQRVDGSGAVFGYQATNSDQADLGDGLFIDEDLANGGQVSVKFLPTGGPWFGSMPATFSADHHSLTLDADLPVTPNLPEHVMGTIACP